MRTIRNKCCLALVLAIGIAGFSVGISSAANTPKQALANVIVGNPTSAIQNLPFWVGEADGNYTAEGLNVKQVLLSAATVTTALVAGSINFSNFSATTFLQARVAGDPVEAIESIIVGFPNGFLVSTQFAQAHGITLKTPLATVAKDLIGSTGGSSSASTTGQIDLLLKSFNIQPSQVTIATLSSVAADETAIEKGQISWFDTAEPIPLEMQQEGYGLVVGSPKNVPAWSLRREGYGSSVVVSDAFANANPGLVRKFVAATRTATAYIAHHELKVLNIAQANTPGVNRDVLFKSYTLAGWPVTGKMNENQWRTSIAFAVQEQAIPHGTKVTENVDWTNKYL